MDSGGSVAAVEKNNPQYCYYPCQDSSRDLVLQEMLNKHSLVNKLNFCPNVCCLNNIGNEVAAFAN